MLYPEYSIQDALLRFDIGRALLTGTERADTAKLFTQHKEPQPLVDAYATLFQNTVYRAQDNRHCLHLRDNCSLLKPAVALVFRTEGARYIVALTQWTRSGLTATPVNAALLALCHYDQPIVWGDIGQGSMRDYCGSAIAEENALKALELPDLYNLAEQGLRSAGVPGDLADHLLQGLRGPDGKPYTPPPLISDEMWRKERFDRVHA